MIPYLERYLVLDVLFLASCVLSGYLLWPHATSYGFFGGAALMLIWAVGRIYTIYTIRAVEFARLGRLYTEEELRSTLMRSHSWWTAEQVNELVSRYLRFQGGDLGAFLLENVRFIDPEETPPEEPGSENE